MNLPTIYTAITNDHTIMINKLSRTQSRKYKPCETQLIENIIDHSKCSTDTFRNLFFVVMFIRVQEEH